jgi:hypothetical protein
MRSLGVLILVTPLLVIYGSSAWSWIGGPVAALLLAILDRWGSVLAWREPLSAGEDASKIHTAGFAESLERQVLIDWGCRTIPRQQMFI